MLRRTAMVSAAAAAAMILSVTAMATNGGVVGNVVDAGENIVNDVVGAGEAVVDDIAGAVTGGRNSDSSGSRGSAAITGRGDSANVVGSAGRSTSVPDEVPEETADTDNNSAAQNPDTGVSFAYGALAALALGGAGMVLTFKRDD